MNHIPKIIKIMKKEYVKYRPPATSDWYTEPYPVLISCLISLRTKDAVTIEAAKRLFKLADNPKKMMHLDIKKIETAIYPAGFYKTKAKWIKDISAKIVGEYNGKVPDTIDELLKFKGIGRKTANIVITYGYGKPGIAVDTHVHRISNRLGLVNTKTPEKTEMALRKILPMKYWLDYNDLLVVWGQNVCKPVNPDCFNCKINKHCKKVGVPERYWKAN